MTHYEDLMQKMTVEEMARIIEDGHGACERCVWKDEACTYKVCTEGIKKWLMEEEEIKAQGGIHAHWIKRNYDNVDGTIYKCSNCNTGMFNEWNYCPHCGAKMDEEVTTE